MADDASSSGVNPAPIPEEVVEAVDTLRRYVDQAQPDGGTAKRETLVFRPVKDGDGVTVTVERAEAPKSGEPVSPTVRRGAQELIARLRARRDSLPHGV